jgi:2-amino-4-hydroxy-6-hydroxymethyldihydropteridine diphosphokinase
VRTRTSSKRTRKSTAAGSEKKRSTDRLSPPSRAAYLGLGSNVGDRRTQLTAALAEIERFASVESVSSFYSSDPVGYTRQRKFWNAAVSLLWAGTPEALLRAVQQVERRVGRRLTFAGGPREIDVDILDLGGAVRNKRDPVLPHPRLAERRFALAPLAEIAPDWRHPVSGLTAKQLLASLPRRPGVRRIGSSRPEQIRRFARDGKRRG